MKSNKPKALKLQKFFSLGEKSGEIKGGSYARMFHKYSMVIEQKHQFQDTCIC